MKSHALKMCLLFFVVSLVICSSINLDDSTIIGKYKMVMLDKISNDTLFDFPCEIDIKLDSSLTMNCLIYGESRSTNLKYFYNKDSILIMIEPNPHVVPDTVIVRKLNGDFRDLVFWPKKPKGKSYMRLEKID